MTQIKLSPLLLFIIILAVLVISVIFGYNSISSKEGFDCSNQSYYLKGYSVIGSNSFNVIGGPFNSLTDAEKAICSYVGSDGSKATGGTWNTIDNSLKVTTDTSLKVGRNKFTSDEDVAIYFDHSLSPLNTTPKPTGSATPTPTTSSTHTHKEGSKNYSPYTPYSVNNNTKQLIDPTTGKDIDTTTGYLIQNGLLDKSMMYKINSINGHIIDPKTGLDIDPATGKLIDPQSGNLIDPTTGFIIVSNPDKGLPSSNHNKKNKDKKLIDEEAVDDYFKWYWYWNSTNGGSQVPGMPGTNNNLLGNSNDYILKTQIVPPVCPACPCNGSGTCTACNSAGYNSSCTNAPTSSPTSSPNGSPNNNDNDAQKVLDKLGKDAQTVASAAGKDAQSVASTLGKDAQTVGSTIGGDIQSVLGTIGSDIQNVAGAIGKDAQNVAGAVGGDIQGVAGAVGRDFQSTVNTAGGNLQNSVGNGTYGDSSVNPYNQGGQNTSRFNGVTTGQSLYQNAGQQAGLPVGNPQNPYTYNGMLSQKPSSKFIPITADFSKFSK